MSITLSLPHGEAERADALRGEAPSPSDCAHLETIRVRSLRASYGSHQVIKGIDLTVQQGEVFAFLGPNGAGKTTTIEILEGFRQRTAGEVSVLGVDPQVANPAWRERVGVVLQQCNPEPDLTVAETIELYAGFYAHPRPVEEVLSLAGLDEQAPMRNRRLSGGQQRRLDVALALVGDPELIFLDEPTTGFDPAARRAAWEMIDGLRLLGKTIVLTTHYLDEAEALADRIAVISGGYIVAEGTPADLGGRDQLPTTISFRSSAEPVLPNLPAELRALGVMRDEHVEIKTVDPIWHLRLLIDWATEWGTSLEWLEVRPPSLEDTYLLITGGDAQ